MKWLRYLLDYRQAQLFAKTKKKCYPRRVVFLILETMRETLQTFETTSEINISPEILKNISADFKDLVLSMPERLEKTITQMEN